MKIIKFFLLAIVFFVNFSTSASATVTVIDESCGDDIFGSVIVPIAFSTDKPTELFEILGRNLGSFNNQGEWKPDPKVEKEVLTFLKTNKIDKDTQKAKIEYVKKLLKPFFDHHKSRKSPINQCMVYLQIDGEITVETLDKFKAIVNDYYHPPFLHVSLNSIGGEVLPALEIGRIIRSQYGITQVGKSSNYQGSQGIGCMSACVLIYAAGIAKNIQLNENGNGQWYPIGIHQHFLARSQVEKLSVEDGINLLKKTRKEISIYLEEMGVPQEFLSLSSSINKETLYYMSENELKLYVPFAVAEYSAIIPIKVTQASTQMVNLFFQGMDAAIKKFGPMDTNNLADSILIYLVALVTLMENNFETIKWGSFQSWYIENGVYYQGL